jgi:thiol-disulfide isomerase/thioredoxin
MAGCANAKVETAKPPQAEMPAKPVIAEAPSAENLDDGEPRPYDKTRNARADVDETLFVAKHTGKNAIIVMGANWCHDSRDLAAHFMTPRFETLLATSFEYVYVDMGIRNRNLDIAADFGIDEVEGTPTIIITDSQGEVLNLDTAKTWRNAASRTDDEIYEEFLSYAPQK